MDCTQLHDLAPELVLGMVPAAQRAAALRHLHTCPTCRREVRELTETADEVLLLAPAADPPPGFEARVLSALDPPARRPEVPVPRTGRPRTRTRLALAAAAALVAVAMATSALLGRQWGSSTAAAAAGGRPTMAAAFVDPAGSEVGAALLMAGPRPYLSVSVTAAGAAAYRVMVDQVGGASEQVGIAPAAGGVCTWTRMLPLPYAAVQSVRLVPMGRGPGYTSRLQG